MEVDDDGHNFTQAQRGFSDALKRAVWKQMLIEVRLKVLAEIVNITEKG
jgi:hypothetical protein